MRTPLLLFGLLLVAGCTSDNAGKSSAAASISPAPASALAILADADRDCLQYRVSSNPDGTEDWNADWVFFSLVTTGKGRPVKDEAGKPMAVNLFHSQVEQFMRTHEPIPNTSWGYVVKRTRRKVRDGKVLSQSDYETLYDVDLAELVQKDRAARTR